MLDERREEMRRDDSFLSMSNGLSGRARKEINLPPPPPTDGPPRKKYVPPLPSVARIGFRRIVRPPLILSSAWLGNVVRTRDREEREEEEDEGWKEDEEEEEEEEGASFKAA